MTRRHVVPLSTMLALALALALSAPAAAAAPAAGTRGSDAKFHLKPGARGKACLACHTDFEETIRKPFVHTPVKSGDCADCHSPHASDHGKLLAADANAICARCHADVVPEKARSVHPDVVAGRCVKCHDPHASANKNQLRESGNAVCFSCHKEMAQSVAAAKFRHAPVGQSCLSCHDPHAGTTTPTLLVKSVPSLCLQCHKADQPLFKRAHANYPVAKADCVSCHDPHGSDQPSILWTNVHMPVKNKMCTQCHYDAAAPNATETKRGGLELCKACHSDTVNEAFSRTRIHWPVVDRTACLNCHRPHAARERKLLRADEKRLCGSCHRDAVARQERSETKHPPNDEGSCTSCHQPHASDAVFLFAGADIKEVCASCHDWGQHSSHPLGDKVLDPRNKNLPVDCESCHRTHGSEFKHFTHFEAKKDLCLQCHERIGR